MSRVSCPYCGSVQVKAMSNQPKKYPRPADPIALADWQRGYDCKKCGNDFIFTPPKPLGLIAKLCGWILLGVVALFLYSAFTSPAKKSSPVTQETRPDEIVEETHQEEVIPPIPEDNPLEQEFSKEAEEAAHAYIPPLEEQNPQREEQEQKSIADSQDQSETLSIKTTIRESE